MGGYTIVYVIMFIETRVGRLGFGRKWNGRVGRNGVERAGDRL